MKQWIVLAAMVGLGVVLFQLIAGDSDTSILHHLGLLWEEEIAQRSAMP